MNGGYFTEAASWTKRKYGLNPNETHQSIAASAGRRAFVVSASEDVLGVA